MAEQRRVPEIERLEGRDMPAAPGLPYLAPPVHLGAAHAVTAPQVLVRTPTTQSAIGESPITRDVVAPIGAGETSPPLAAVWQQAADVLFAIAGERCDTVGTAWAQPHVPRDDAATNGVAATGPKVVDAVAASAVAPPAHQTPTISGVLRYAWRSVSRHRVDDPDDAVQQIGFEWLLLAATIQTTYDDVRRIVARVIDRAYRRFKKQQQALELLDIPVHADRVQDAFRDMQLDRDLGVRDLTDAEWQVVGLRRQGFTFAEIGLQVGIRKQRAREMFQTAVSYLQKRYCD
jgi:hypothetical protein